MSPLLELRGVTFGYDAGPDVAHVLRHVDLDVEEGDLVLVAGPTGSGKSTLLGTVTGLVPRFSGGVLSGDVRLDDALGEVHRLGGGAVLPPVRTEVVPAEHEALARLLVGDRLEDRVEGEERVTGEVHLRDHPLREFGAEEREVDVRRPPCIVVVLPRVGAGFDRRERQSSLHSSRT